MIYRIIKSGFWDDWLTYYEGRFRFKSNSPDNQLIPIISISIVDSELSHHVLIGKQFELYEASHGGQC